MRVSIGPVIVLLFKIGAIKVVSPKDAKKLSEYAACLCIEIAQWMNGRDLREMRDYFEQLALLNSKTREVE